MPPPPAPATSRFQNTSAARQHAAAPPMHQASAPPMHQAHAAPPPAVPAAPAAGMGMMGMMGTSMVGSMAGSVIGGQISNMMSGGSEAPAQQAAPVQQPSQQAWTQAPQTVAPPTVDACKFQHQEFMTCMTNTGDNALPPRSNRGCTAYYMTPARTVCAHEPLQRSEPDLCARRATPRHGLSLRR